MTNETSIRAKTIFEYTVPERVRLYELRTTTLGRTDLNGSVYSRQPSHRGLFEKVKHHVRRFGFWEDATTQYE